MGLCKDQWIAEDERIGEELWAGDIDIDEAWARWQALGVDTNEIHDRIAEYKADMGEEAKPRFQPPFSCIDPQLCETQGRCHGGPACPACPEDGRDG